MYKLLEAGYEYVMDLDPKTLAYSSVALVSVLSVGGFIAWKFSDRYLHQKIMRESLTDPFTLNKLMKWRRRDHDFILSLRREINFLAKWFKNNEELEFKDVTALAKRSFSDDDFFRDEFEESEQKVFLRIATHLILFKMSKLQISSLSDKKFLVGTSVHEDKLMRLWKNLRNDNLKERKTMQWVDIGFQGKDPSTDFRGAGMLGLE